MSVLAVRPVGDAQFTTGSRGERTYRRTFRVRCSTPDAEKLEILTCGLLPVYGASPYPADLLAICNNIDLKQNTQAPYWWECAVTWATLQAGDPKDKQKPPDQRRPTWTYKFQPLQKYFPSDVRGNAYWDSANTPFAPSPPRAIYVDEITIQRFEPSCNRADDRNYMGKCNQNPWQGADPSEALMQEIACQEQFEQGQWWFNYTYVILVNPRVYIPGSLFQPQAPALPAPLPDERPFIGAWDYECILDRGPNCFPTDFNGVPTSKKPQAIKIGNIVAGRPVPLNGQGSPLADDPSAESLCYLKFRNAEAIDFDARKLVPPY